jgi:hypothetical protein
MFEPIYCLDDEHINSLFNGSIFDIHNFWQGLHDNEYVNIDFEKHFHYDMLTNSYDNPNVCKYFKKLIKVDDIDWPNKWRYFSNTFADLEFLEEHVDKLDFDRLSMNPYAVPLLEKYPEKIHYGYLLGNPNATHLLKNMDIDEILSNSKNNENHEYYFYKNDNAIDLIEQYLENKINNGRIDEIKKYNTFLLSLNIKLVPFLEKHPELIDWGHLSRNPCAIHLLKNNMDKISWEKLSANPNAIELIEGNLDKVVFSDLCMNHNAVHIIKKYANTPNSMSNDDLLYLSMNRSEDAIELIKEKIKHVCPYHIGTNPNVLKIVGKLDYDAMKTKCQPFAQELVTYVLNPTRLLRLCDTYGLDLEEYMELLGDE